MAYGNVELFHGPSAALVRREAAMENGQAMLRGIRAGSGIQNINLHQRVLL